METDGVSVSLISINIWRRTGETLNITFNFLCCNHQVHRNLLITLLLNTGTLYRIWEITVRNYGVLGE
jgi:hypothetical protein